MKKLLLATILLLPIAAFSQDEHTIFNNENGKKFFGGLTAGINCSQVDGDNYSGFHSAGLNAGGLVYWFFAPNVAGSMEFLFSQKGSHGVNEAYSPYGGAYYAKYKLRLNYVEVPIVFHYVFPIKNHQYLVGLGGSFNALLNSKESMEDMGVPVSFDPGDYPFNEYTFDIIGSIGMLFGKHFIVEARYQYGLTPLRDWDKVAPFVPGMGERDELNNMMAFRLIYLF